MTNASRTEGPGVTYKSGDPTTLLPGTLLYSLMRLPLEDASREEHAGELYMLLSPYDGSSAPECAQLLS